MRFIVCTFLASLWILSSLLGEELPDILDKDLRTRDYSQYQEATEYRKTEGMSSMLSRAHWVNKTGNAESLVKNPEELDERREAILGALWFYDETTFNELAASPITGEGGLANHKFDRIAREFRKYNRNGIRTMRSHPFGMDGDKEQSTIMGRHQWMTLPKLSSTPKRGNINLIFDAGDLSLRFVRISFFPSTRDQFPLPSPDSNIPNDPVVDRGPSDERVMEKRKQEESSNE